MATHSGVPAWRTPQTQGTGAYSPRGHKESDVTERLTHQAPNCFRLEPKRQTDGPRPPSLHVGLVWTSTRGGAGAVWPGHPTRHGATPDSSVGPRGCGRPGTRGAPSTSRGAAYAPCPPAAHLAASEKPEPRGHPPSALGSQHSSSSTAHGARPMGHPGHPAPGCRLTSSNSAPTPSTCTSTQLSGKSKTWNELLPHLILFFNNSPTFW